MAFCNSCGAPMEDSMRSCPSCGATALAPAASYPSAAAQRPSSGRAARIIAIVAVVVVAVCVLGTIGAVFALKKIAHRVRVEAGPESALITTPMGSVTANDSEAVAKQFGVDVFPGARGIRGSAVVGFGGMQVSAAKFESDAAPEKVIEFYQRRYPNAALRVVGRDNSMVFSTSQGMVTIKVRSRGQGSLIEIAHVGGDVLSTQDKAKSDTN